MNWTKPNKPTQDISRYDHVICETPLGIFKIEWKGWNANDGYSLTLDDNDWIGVEYDLRSAKTLARNYLIQKHKELSAFLA